VLERCRLRKKFTAGPRLFSLALEAMRAGIRLQNPNATEAEVQEIIRQRLEKKRRREEVKF
jgi:Xaa-Pro aminopeptidase